MPIVNPLLPEDAIVEILSRLPAKSLARFKCVSKSWHALITNPHFIIQHFIGSNNSNESLLISHTSPVNTQLLSSHSYQTLETETNLFQLSYANANGRTRSYVQITGPCNGVFCLFDGQDNNISLWNPANRALKFLPPSHVQPPESSYPFDVCVGFGFDALTNDYKVFAYKHMCFPSSATIAHAELFSVKEDKWKEIDVGEEFQPTGNLPPSTCSPSIDGVFSWFDVDNRVEKVIFSFDMKEEVFMKTQLPDYEGVPSKRVHGCLASLKSSLAFIHDYPLGGVCQSFDVWVLGEYGVRESWTKQLTIGPIIGVKGPLAFWKNGELLFEDDDGKLVSYDPVNEDMKEFGAPGVKHFLQVIPYKESLVCLQEHHGESRREPPFSICECEADGA